MADLTFGSFALHCRRAPLPAAPPVAPWDGDWSPYADTAAVLAARLGAPQGTILAALRAGDQGGFESDPTVGHWALDAGVTIAGGPTLRGDYKANPAKVGGLSFEDYFGEYDFPVEAQPWVFASGWWRVPLIVPAAFAGRSVVLGNTQRGNEGGSGLFANAMLCVQGGRLRHKIAPAGTFAFPVGSPTWTTDVDVGAEALVIGAGAVEVAGTNDLVSGGASVRSRVYVGPVGAPVLVDDRTVALDPSLAAIGLSYALLGDLSPHPSADASIWYGRVQLGNDAVSPRPSYLAA